MSAIAFMVKPVKPRVACISPVVLLGPEFSAIDDLPPSWEMASFLGSLQRGNHTREETNSKTQHFDHAHQDFGWAAIVGQGGEIGVG
jgi:hypothetical protein